MKINYTVIAANQKIKQQDYVNVGQTLKILFAHVTIMTIRINLIKNVSVKKILLMKFVVKSMNMINLITRNVTVKNMKKNVNVMILVLLLKKMLTVSVNIIRRISNV